jgi:hypothetical protein
LGDFCTLSHQGSYNEDTTVLSAKSRIIFLAGSRAGDASYVVVLSLELELLALSETAYKYVMLRVFILHLRSKKPRKCRSLKKKRSAGAMFFR